jgi:hypothetical protein
MSPIVVVDDEILSQNLKQLVWSNCRYGVQILILYVYKQACEILRYSILKMKYSKTKRTNSCKMVSQTAVTMCDSSIGNK